jgi:transcriptional regulator of acetoin/glycerol metabolism
LFGRFGPRGNFRGLSAAAIALARAMHTDKTVAINDICAALGVGRTTFYRYLKAPQGKAS